MYTYYHYSQTHVCKIKYLPKSMKSTQLCIVSKWKIWFKLLILCAMKSDAYLCRWRSDVAFWDVLRNHAWERFFFILNEVKMIICFLNEMNITWLYGNYLCTLLLSLDFNTELQYAKQGLPKYEDLTGAATALMRLQDTYHLDTSNIAHGDLGGVLSSTLSGKSLCCLVELVFQLCGGMFWKLLRLL